MIHYFSDVNIWSAPQIFLEESLMSGTKCFIKDYSFITYVRVPIRGLEMLIFSENGWYLSHIVLSSKSIGKGLGIQNFTKVFLWKYFFGLLSSKKNLCYLLDWKPFKNDEKCFLFHLENSICSQDIYVFVMTFWSCRKNDMIKKIGLTHLC